MANYNRQSRMPERTSNRMSNRMPERMPNRMPEQISERGSENMRTPIRRDCDFNNMPVAMAYVPWQYFNTVYEVDKALQHGTIFPELNKPWYGKRGVTG